MKTSIIIGYGNIGQKLHKEYAKLNPDIYDPYKGFNHMNPSYDFAFICVDTPLAADGSCDLSQVKAAINEVNAKIIVLRSTVPPGTTDALIQETQKEIVFCPEFYGVTQHSDAEQFDFNFTICGGRKDLCSQVIQLLQHIYDGRHRFCITEAKVAELAKYMENTLLATKVSMCVQFYQIAQQLGINYEEMRELVLQDPRINRSHTFVYAEQPYWDSHCFNKDLQTIANMVDAPLIQSVIDFNNKCKESLG